MKTLLLIASLLAATPDAGTPVKKPDAGLVDAGLDRDAVIKRRFKLLEIVNKFKVAMEDAGAVVKIEEILFATGSTNSKDAAMVIGTLNGKRSANFFVFDDGKWAVFPTDFASESVPPVP